MGLFDRLKGKQAPQPPPAATNRIAVSANLYSGSQDLDVVGESNYQEALWSLCGSSPGEQVRHEVIAVLVPEPENPYDQNAIAVQIDARLVGYLSREDAIAYGPGLRALMTRTGAYVALEGVIAGG